VVVHFTSSILGFIVSEYDPSTYYSVVCVSIELTGCHFVQREVDYSCERLQWDAQYLFCSLSKSPSLQLIEYTLLHK
jgi:hypothetical protein